MSSYLYNKRFLPKWIVTEGDKTVVATTRKQGKRMLKKKDEKKKS